MHTISQDKINNALILVVDDIELNHKMLEHSLQAVGYTNILIANDGQQALKITQEKNPDIVILDLMMPHMDGFAYLEVIRNNPAFKNTPILVQTVLEDIENKIKAFSLGASDYICKPLDPTELAARVHVHLSNKLLTQELLDYQRSMKQEFESARKMQTRIMPSAQQINMSERVYDMKIANYFETSSHLGGDCWGMRPISETQFALWMFDFSGHGITAAMNVFRLHTVMQEFLHASADPGNFLSTLNRHIYPLLERHEFCTMFYGVVDVEANCLLYSSAAAQPACLFSSSNQNSVSLYERGLPLGSIAATSYETRFTAFAPGDLLLFYSDCLVETKNQAGQFIDEQALMKLVQNTMLSDEKNPALFAIEKIMSMFKAHSEAPLGDDLTINAYYRCVRQP